MFDEDEFEDHDSLAHYGTPRHSGRYPWGSGEDPYQDNKGFMQYVNDMKKDGLTEKDIAEGLGYSIRDMRSKYSRARNTNRQQDIMFVQKLRDKGMSTQAISERTGIPEPTVRSHLKPGVLDKARQIDNTKVALEQELAKSKYIDIGVGVEHHIGVSREQLRSAVNALTDEGWQVHYLNVPQVTIPGQFTRTTVLAPPGTKTTDIYNDFESIGTIGAHTEDFGRTMLGIAEPLSVNSKRVQVVYAEEGGAEADGLVYVRPGVEDISLGGNHYAQVRIAVDGTHFIKGMAVYKDDLPAGVDLQFNTNKSDTGNKLAALKPLKDDPDNPFGSSIKRQITKKDRNGHDVAVSAMNIVNESGDWDDWNKSLPSQMLSKQSPALAKKQLAEVAAKRQAEYEEIAALTNPTVKKHLLMKFSDSVDSDAVDLQAAAIPRQATSVIIPMRTLKDTEIYAPRFNNGDHVVLVRFPHGGTFEMPELTVNNRNREGKATIPAESSDVVGINSKVAQQLSGADFDGDTVLVIPNEQTGTSKIRTTKPLEQLKGFDPQRAYPAYEGMEEMSASTKQQQMGDVSNLITDMTIKGATHEEIARAVKHSMVVIDAEKHNLDWRQSRTDQNIVELKRKYQARDDGSAGGASTIISRSTSEAHIKDRKLRRASEGGPIDPKTGELVYTPTEKTQFVYTRDKDGNVTGLEEIPVTIKVDRGSVTRDAHELVSSPGTPIERVYADHSNKLKAIANTARKEYLVTKDQPRSKTAAKVYADAVDKLKVDLTAALSNAPIERRAQILANVVVASKKAANPNYTKDSLKKWKNQAIAEMRARLGANKIKVPITDVQWEAIQAGAVSKTMLEQILTHTDLERVKELATPRTRPILTPGSLSRARAMVAGGATLAEVAQALGVSTTTLSSALRGV